MPNRTLFALIGLVLGSMTAAHSQAQVEAGVFSIGGSLSYSKGTTSDLGGKSKNELTALTPAIYAFALDRVQIGLSWGYEHFKSRHYRPDGTEGGGFLYKRQQYGLNARYCYPVESHFAFAGLGYVYMVDLDNYIARAYTMEAGVAAFVTNSLSVEPSVRYFRTFYTSYEDSGLLVTIGLRYYFL